jgi:ketosteroid isomerase-like protein
MTPVEQAVARSEIEALIAEFAWLIDHGESGRVAALFTDDGWYGRDSGERSTGHAEIARAYAERADGGERTARHIFTNLRLSFVADDAAEGECILLLFAADGRPPLPAEPMLVQDYLDRYRRVDGHWRFASRQTRRIFASPAYRQVLPLGGR